MLKKLAGRGNDEAIIKKSSRIRFDYRHLQSVTKSCEYSFQVPKSCQTYI